MPFPPATRIRIALPDWISEMVDWDAVHPTLDERMRLAIELARENVLRGTGGPFGAAVFESETGRLVAVGVNCVERLRNSALHAEIVALMLAQRRLRSYTLRSTGAMEYDLFASCEPCAMCLGAVLWSGIQRLVYGATREDALGLGFEEGPVFPASFGYLESRGVEIVPDLLRAEARAVLDLYAARGGLIYNG